MLKFPIALNVVLIPALLVAQAYTRQRYEGYGLPLSFSTRVALGGTPLLVLVGLLLATLIVGRSANARIRDNWEMVVVIVGGMVVGHQILAALFAFPWGLDLLAFSIRSMTQT